MCHNCTIVLLSLVLDTFDDMKLLSNLDNSFPKFA